MKITLVALVTLASRERQTSLPFFSSVKKFYITDPIGFLLQAWYRLFSGVFSSTFPSATTT
jgi:hypothetical protein